MFKTSRRGFMVGCSAAIASITSGIRMTAFGSPADELTRNILLAIFLRGGMDGLSVVMPLDGADRGHYEGKRPQIAVPASQRRASGAQTHQLLWAQSGRSTPLRALSG